MKSLPWILLAVAVAYPVLAQQVMTKERFCCLTAEQEEILSHMSIVHLDDGFGNAVNKTIRIEGVNVQIVNGTGVTEATPNGVGNVIVGYNELGNPLGDDRTGSHNFVGGRSSSYASVGGFVVGEANVISSPWCSVTGGYGGTASKHRAVVVGGSDNVASGTSSVVVGGANNNAAAEQSIVVGGFSNGSGTSRGVVVGGSGNAASGFASVVVGGHGNVAAEQFSTVSGGRLRTASGEYDWVAGSLFEEE